MWPLGLSLPTCALQYAELQVVPVTYSINNENTPSHTHHKLRQFFYVYIYLVRSYHLETLIFVSVLQHVILETRNCSLRFSDAF